MAGRARIVGVLRMVIGVAGAKLQAVAVVGATALVASSRFTTRTLAKARWPTLGTLDEDVAPALAQAGLDAPPSLGDSLPAAHTRADPEPLAQASGRAPIVASATRTARNSASTATIVAEDASALGSHVAPAFLVLQKATMGHDRTSLRDVEAATTP